MTVSSKGLLLYMQGNVHNDFFALELVSGQLLFSYDLGSGCAQIKTIRSYNDGMLHRASIPKCVLATLTYLFSLLLGRAAT